MSQVNVNPPEPRPTGSQVNVNQPGPELSRDENAGTAATRNLTWAIAVVLVITALAIAIVYVLHSLMR